MKKIISTLIILVSLCVYCYAGTGWYIKITNNSMFSYQIDKNNGSDCWYADDLETEHTIHPGQAITLYTEMSNGDTFSHTCSSISNNNWYIRFHINPIINGLSNMIENNFSIVSAWSVNAFYTKQVELAYLFPTIHKESTSWPVNIVNDAYFGPDASSQTLEINITGWNTFKITEKGV